MGVRYTIDAGEPDPAAHLKKLTNDDLPTCVVDATGSGESMARCFDLTAPGGRIVFVGLFQGDLTFNDPNFHRRELTLLASRNSPRPILTASSVWSSRRDRYQTVDHASDAVRSRGGRVPKWLEPDSGVLKAIIEL